LAALRQCSGQAVVELDLTDERLAHVLRVLGDDGRWPAFEGALNQNLLRVYTLSAERIRLDSTTASGYWSVSEEGLLPFGHSKLGALQTRVFGQADDDFYLCRLRLVQEGVHERQVRAYGQRPARVQLEQECQLLVSVDEGGIQAAERTFGWRIYVTQQASEGLCLSQARLVYRSEYLIEHDFARLKGKPLSLAPMSLRTDQRIKGLMRLLTLGLCVLTLCEFVVRQRLAAEQTTLAGLYQDSPKHVTARPTAERLREVCNQLTLTTLHVGDQVHRHLTPLSPLQQRILTLLDFSPDIYTSLSALSENLPSEYA